MISTIELYRATKERLEKEFPNILVQQKDIKNIIRPSFYIQYVGKTLEKQAVEFWDDRISFNIVYFAKEDKLLELLEIEEHFVGAFKAPLMIQDDKYIIVVEKNSLNSNLNEEDYILNLTIDFNLMQRMSDDETGEDMENLGVEIINANTSDSFEYDESNMDDIEI